MNYRIRSIITGLKNLWKWRKTIYHDRNWDHWFIYQILKTKLELQADHIEKNGLHENSDRDVAEMREVVRLIDIVQNEKIIDAALQAEKWSDELFDEADRKHNEAKKELFTKLHNGIDHWWD
jgi:hypothetical protein